MPKSDILRIVVDTNLWISFLISDRQRRLDSLIYSNRIRFLFSAELLEGLDDTIQKPKLKRYFSKNALEEMLLALEDFIEIIEVECITEVCRDPKDNFLLALAKDGKADFLLTGDKDLLRLLPSAKRKFVQFQNFLMK